MARYLTEVGWFHKDPKVQAMLEEAFTYGPFSTQWALALQFEKNFDKLEWEMANPTTKKTVDLGEKIYPRTPRKRRDKTGRRWRVDYDLAYEGGGDSQWSGYYRTRLGALISAWINEYVKSYGGNAVLYDQVGGKI